LPQFLAVVDAAGGPVIVRVGGLWVLAIGVVVAAAVVVEIGVGDEDAEAAGVAPA
jgi:hypothetical protein